MDAGFKALALNDGLMEIDLSEGAAEPEPETPAEEAPVTASKRPAKKAAAKPKESYTRDQLSEMELPQLKEIASAQGIELPSRTRMSTYIDKILGEDKPDAPSVEITEPPVTITRDADEEIFQHSSNGDIDPEVIESIVNEVTDAVIERIVTALQA